MKKEKKEMIGDILFLIGVVMLIITFILARFTNNTELTLCFAIPSPFLMIAPLALEEHKGGCCIDRWRRGF